MKAFFKQVDIIPLVFFRIAFGILGMVDVAISFIGYNYIYPSYALDHFRFKYAGFAWVEPFPQFILVPFFIAMMIIPCFIAAGKWYRVLTPIFAFGELYIFFLEKAHYLNHHYLFIWICFVMCFVPAHRYFSLDAKEGRVSKSWTTPYWSLLIFQFMMGVVYFYGGIAKLNGDWLRAQPLKIWLGRKKGHFLFGDLLTQEWVAYFMSYGGLVLDLTVVFFLLFKRTRLFALAAVVIFHVTNLLIFEIGIFPFLSTALTLLFFTASDFRKVINWFIRKFKFLGSVELAKNLNLSQDSVVLRPGKQMWQTTNKRSISFALVVIFAFHLLLPLRHHLYDSKVAWSEEGHRYSWRMMLRGKKWSGFVYVKEKVTGKVTKVNLEDYGLDWRQRSKMMKHPDMIVEFARYLKQEYASEGKDIGVYSKVKLKLNDHPYKPYLDPEVDLTQVQWSFFQTDRWILPFEASEIK